MRIKHILIAAMALMATSAVNAQKRSFTLDDLMSGGKNYRNYTTTDIRTTWWGDEAVKLEKEECSVINKKSGAVSRLFTLGNINRILAQEGKGSVASLATARFPIGEKSIVVVNGSAGRAVIDWKSGKLVSLYKAKEAGEDYDFAPCSATKMAVTRNHNLYIVDGANETVVTTDGTREIVYAESVHRNEFGISKGTFWSPEGNKIAFYRMDQSMVADYPQVDISTRIASPDPDKYPMAGETSHKVTVGVYDLRSGSTVYLKAGDPTDRYFTNISWSPDESKVYMIELNRDQNHAQLVRYDAQSGEREAVLYEEKSDKYVEPQTPIVFLPWNNGQFIMQSQKDGYNHLYLFAADGTPIRQITKGEWVVEQLVGFNQKTKSAIILSHELSPLKCNAFAVDLKTGRRTLLDSGTGVHSVSISASGEFLVDVYSDLKTPRSRNILSTARKNILNLHISADPWAEFDVPEISGGSIKAADGVTDLYYRMVKPVGFDASKKYPTVVYVYGGPHAHNVDDSFRHKYRPWEIYMAQKGYIVFVLDNRGSENRGFEFESATFRHLGDEEMKDQIKGVEFLKSLPYVDAERLGVHGWSFGGFMTTNLMLTYPDVFKVGVAGGPVIDWRYYEIMYGERYMDTPQTNPDGYKGSCLNDKAGNLKGRLLVIYGGNDPTCVPQHTLSFIRSCIDAGTHPDLFTYPGDGHNMFGSDQIHLHEHITRYFDDHLK